MVCVPNPTATMSTPITLTPAGMTLSGSYLFNYPKDTPNREVEALLSNLFPQPCWDWTKHDGEANVFLHQGRLVSWLVDGDASRNVALTSQRRAWEATMLPLTPEAVRLALTPKPKPVVDPKTKTIAFSVEVKKTYHQEFNYDNFVDLLEMEFDLSKGTRAEFDAKVLPLWVAFLKKHKKGIVLKDIDEGDIDAEDDENICLIEAVGDVDEQLRGIVNPSE